MSIAPRLIRRDDVRKLTSGLLALLLITVFLFPPAISAKDLSATQLSALETVGIPLYPGSTYTTGDEDIATIMWFSSDDSPGKIMHWFAEQLPDWSEVEVNNLRVLYKGPPGIEAKDLSSVVYLWARTANESGVDVDTEITVFIPK
jgi:hypothetical protein